MANVHVIRKYSCSSKAFVTVVFPAQERNCQWIIFSEIQSNPEMISFYQHRKTRPTVRHLLDKSSSAQSSVDHDEVGLAVSDKLCDWIMFSLCSNCSCDTVVLKNR